MNFENMYLFSSKSLWSYYYDFIFWGSIAKILRPKSTYLLCLMQKRFHYQKHFQIKYVLHIGNIVSTSNRYLIRKFSILFNSYITINRHWLNYTHLISVSNEFMAEISNTFIQMNNNFGIPFWKIGRKFETFYVWKIAFKNFVWFYFFYIPSIYWKLANKEILFIKLVFVDF